MKDQSYTAIRKMRLLFNTLCLLSILFLLFACGGQSNNSSSDPVTSTTTVNLKASFIDAANMRVQNALGTPGDVESVTVKVVKTSNNYVVVPETDLTDDTPGSGNWVITLEDMPTGIELKFFGKAYNGEDVVIYTDTIVTTFSAGDTSSDVVFKMESVDDGVEPENPSIDSATIPTQIKVNDEKYIWFDISHSGDVNYEVEIINGTVTPSSGTHDPSDKLYVYYTAPATAGQDTIKLTAWSADTSSDIISVSYPINVVAEDPTLTGNLSVLFGPAIVGMDFYRTSTSLELKVKTDPTSDLDYSWTGTGDFLDVSADTNPLEISSYSDTDAGTITITVTDDNDIEASLTRTIAAGDFGYVVNTPPDQVMFLPDTGQVTGYTETFGEDADYVTPRYFTDNGDGTVTDNSTNLTWQQQGDATADATWTNAVSYCQNLTLGGSSNWRLPFIKELQSIADYEYSDPVIDTTVFTGTASDLYWSATTNASNAYYVSFQFGTINRQAQTAINPVRCVQGDSSSDIWPADYLLINEDTAFHQSTGLTWQREDDNTVRTWENALTYCEGLVHGGFDDWRLPNIRELQTIVDYSIESPAIDASVFPGTNHSISYPYSYWSSTTYPSSSTSALLTNFTYGNIVNSVKTNSTYGYTRCVRGKQ